MNNERAVNAVYKGQVLVAMFLILLLSMTFMITQTCVFAQNGNDSDSTRKLSVDIAAPSSDVTNTHAVNSGTMGDSTDTNQQEPMDSITKTNDFSKQENSLGEVAPSESAELRATLNQVVKVLVGLLAVLGFCKLGTSGLNSTSQETPINSGSNSTTTDAPTSSDTTVATSSDTTVATGKAASNQGTNDIKNDIRYKKVISALNTNGYTDIARAMQSANIVYDQVKISSAGPNVLALATVGGNDIWLADSYKTNTIERFAKTMIHETLHNMGKDNNQAYPMADEITNKISASL